MNKFSTMWRLPVWKLWNFLQPQLSIFIPKQCKVLLVHQARKGNHRTGLLLREVSNSHYSGCSCDEYEYVLNSKHKPLVFFCSIENHPTCGFDAVYVYDGYSNSYRVLGTICGSQRATFYSTGAYLTVYFKSDGVVNSQGFRANYRTVCRSCWSHLRYWWILHNPECPWFHKRKIIIILLMVATSECPTWCFCSQRVLQVQLWIPGWKLLLLLKLSVLGDLLSRLQQ